MSNGDREQRARAAVHAVIERHPWEVAFCGDTEHGNLCEVFTAELLAFADAEAARGPLRYAGAMPDPSASATAGGVGPIADLQSAQERPWLPCAADGCPGRVRVKGWICDDHVPAAPVPVESAAGEIDPAFDPPDMTPDCGDGGVHQPYCRHAGQPFVSRSVQRRVAAQRDEPTPTFEQLVERVGPLPTGALASAANPPPAAGRRAEFFRMIEEAGDLPSGAMATSGLTEARARQSDLEAFRDAGWSVAVHNDYRLNGQRFTFWLFTHPSGRWVKGEGATDEEAVGLARRHAVMPQPASAEASPGDVREALVAWFTRELPDNHNPDAWADDLLTCFDVRRRP